MDAQLQTVLALLIVAIAAVWLVVRALAKRKQPGCGTDCGAVSPEIRKLQARLKHRS
jgi:hypothetical protein